MVGSDDVYKFILLDKCVIGSVCFNDVCLYCICGGGCWLKIFLIQWFCDVWVD